MIRILIGLGIKWFWCCLLSCINCEQMQAMLIILKISYWHIYNNSTVICTSRLDTVALTYFFNVFVNGLDLVFFKANTSSFRVSGLVVICVCDIHLTQTNKTLTYIIISQVIRIVFISEIDKLVSKLINWTENSYF